MYLGRVMTLSHSLKTMILSDTIVCLSAPLVSLSAPYRRASQGFKLDFSESLHTSRECINSLEKFESINSEWYLRVSERTPCESDRTVTASRED